VLDSADETTTSPSASSMDKAVSGLERAVAEGDDDCDILAIVWSMAGLFFLRTSRSERREVGSRLWSFLEISAEYGSMSCQIASSWSGSGWRFGWEVKNRYPFATEKKEDDAPVDVVEGAVD